MVCRFPSFSGATGSTGACNVTLLLVVTLPAGLPHLGVAEALHGVKLTKVGLHWNLDGRRLHSTTNTGARCLRQAA